MSGEDPRLETIQHRRALLKSRITEIGAEVDSYKARGAAALGGAVFALLMAAGAAYDIVAKKSSLWRTVGLSREGLHWLAGLFAIAGVAMLVIGVARTRRRDLARDAKLAELEEEMADLSDK